MKTLFLVAILAIASTLSVHAQCLCFPKLGDWNNADSLFAIDTCLIQNDVPCDSILLTDKPSKYDHAVYTKQYYIVFDTMNYFPRTPPLTDTTIFITWQKLDSIFTATRAGFAALEARFGSFLIRKPLRNIILDPSDLRYREAALVFSNFQLGDSLDKYIHAITGIDGGQRIPAFIDNQTSVKEYFNNIEHCESIIPHKGVLPIPEIARIKGWRLVNIIGETVRSYEGESLDETVNLSTINSGVYFAVFPNCSTLILLTGNNQ